MAQRCAFTPSQTLPNSPFLDSSKPLCLEDLPHIFVKLHNSIAQLPATNNVTGLCEASPAQPREKASKLKFKTVEEVYNTKEYKYKISEIKAAPEVVELDEYVLVVRKRIDRHTARPTTYIDVNSDCLRDFLKQTLRDVKGLDLREDKLSVEHHVLFHYIDQLQRSHRYIQVLINQNDLLKQHLGLLLTYLQETFKPVQKHVEALLEHKEITYDLFWALCPPNTIIWTQCPGTKKPQCVKFAYGEEKFPPTGPPYLNLHCRYLDFDGANFGEASTDLRIPKFRGAQKIQTLDHYPLLYHEDRQASTADIVRCGQKFLAVMEGSHLHCEGTAFFMEEDEYVKVAVNSRVKIDPKMFRQINPNYCRQRIKETDEDEFYDLFARVDVSEVREVKAPRMAKDLTDNDYLICSPTVRGFGLVDKLWLEFAVADLWDISWNPAPFDSLVMPLDRKTTMLALVNAHTNKKSGPRFDDVVIGKGQGLNVLLYGPPGVGKTLTAEAVTEHLQRPLYSISAGELNLNDVGQLERQLSKIFQTARAWNAIMLLDEADVFLEARDTLSLERNRLVATFLRTLEYCTGILFLTTNRVTHFDEAVLSRIHLKFRYESLSKADRVKVWKSNLDRAKTSQGCPRLDKSEKASLAEKKFNGREIKLAVATAHALATEAKTVVQFMHLKVALDLNEEFTVDSSGRHENLYS